MTDIENLLWEMLKIPSVSGGEKEIGEFIISNLSDFKVKRQFVDKERFNVVARKGRSQVWIIVHMDTVPGEVPLKITKEKISGRGAIDNKGNIAGAIMAGKKLENINLLFTVGEEDDFIGAKKAKIPCGKAIVMEPTRMRVMSGQRGILSFNVIARGRQKHSSLSFKKTDSAVYNLTDVLKELYDKNWTAFNAIILKGGEADNVVAPYAEAKVLARPKDVKECESIMRYLKKFRRRNVEMKIEGVIEPCLSCIMNNGKTVPYFSEMAFFKDSVLFGVGDISVAHTKFEYVLRKDLNKLEKKLVSLVRKLEKS